MDLVDGGGRQQPGRGLEGPEGRFEQNTHGGGLGPQGAPNAPISHDPSPDFPNGANDWETHDKEIEKQQDDLKEKLQEMDDDCGGGSRRQQKDLDHAKEVSKRARPKKEEWDGPKWEPAPTPEPQGLSMGQKVLIVGGVLLIAGGIIGSVFTGGGSLAASAAGVAIIAGTGAGATGQGDPGGA
jgi:hypothetical protein